MYDTKKTTTEYKRWHREEDGTMVPDVTDYVKFQAWIDTLDPTMKEEYEGKTEFKECVTEIEMFREIESKRFRKFRTVKLNKIPQIVDSII